MPEYPVAENGRLRGGFVGLFDVWFKVEKVASVNGFDVGRELGV